MANFQLFFQSRKQVVVRRGRIWRIGWVINTMEAHVGQFLLGCKCSVSRSARRFDDLPAAFFLQSVIQLHQQRWVKLRVDSLAFWKIIKEEAAVLIPQNRGEKFYSGFLRSEYFGAGGPLCRHSIDCCFVSWSWWYNQVSSMVTNSDRKSFGSRRTNSKICSDDWHRWRFCFAFRHFGIHFAESFRMFKSSWMMDQTHSREMPSCSDIDLDEIRRSFNISSWIWSIVYGVVTVLGLPGLGTWQVKKSPRLNWAAQCLTVAYDGACSLMFLSEWREFPSGPCLAGKKNLIFASIYCWNHARSLPCFFYTSVRRKDLQFDTWKDSSYERHHQFRPTTPGSRSGQGLISTPSYSSYTGFWIDSIITVEAVMNWKNWVQQGSTNRLYDGRARI